MSGRSAIVLAAGGTGGHIFPAQALADELLGRGRSLALVTDRRGEAYSGALSRIETYRVRAGGTASRGRLGLPIALLESALGAIEAWRLLKRLRPATVVGFGGYPSLPTMIAAWFAGISMVLHEQNAVLGRVNRLIAGRASRIATSFDGTRGIAPGAQGRVSVTGNPVRAEIVALNGVPYTPPEVDGQVHLLVFGGSQGASVFGQVVPAAIASLPEGLRTRLVVTQQCRESDLELVRALYKSVGVAVELRTFFRDMPLKFARAHLVIARAGASTVAELALVGRPSILVPYPHATDDHQSANAEALVRAGGAWAFDHRRFTPDALAQRLEELLCAPEQLAVAAKAAHRCAHPNAAGLLADLVEAAACPTGAAS
jgi:UDP-N-acetylglucosamine--N-acetylmuramyl-(pentapeptide) pyrophosphoryl-undecaprenol N-acetylglucosamine transferase